MKTIYKFYYFHFMKNHFYICYFSFIRNIFSLTSLLVIIVALKSKVSHLDELELVIVDGLPSALELGLHFLPYLHVACYEWLLRISNCEASVFCSFSQMSGFFCFSRQLMTLQNGVLGRSSNHSSHLLSFAQLL